MEESFASTYLLPVVIGIIMFNLGLGLRLQDFRRIVHNPGSFFVGLFSQMVLLPLLAFGIASISELSPEVKVGIVIIAACPGGAVSNLITYYLKGNVPLSISLTSVNSFIILITIPVIVHIALNIFLSDSTYIEMPVLYTISRVFFMIIIPVIIGMIVRARTPKRADKMENILKYATVLLLAVVYSFVIFEKNDGSMTSLSRYLEIAPYVFALNVMGMLAGYFAARLFRFNMAKQITLSVEVGIQNSALAITIAGGAAFLGNHEMALPAVVYGMFTFFNAVIFGLIIRKWLGYYSNK
ncbi:MAG: bile acid:sodium symporter family protein [Bacteroidales bacterium]